MVRRLHMESFHIDSPPVGTNVSYECLKCGAVLNSQPKNAVYCDCYNIIVDADGGRFSVKDPMSFKVLVEE